MSIFDSHMWIFFLFILFAIFLDWHEGHTSYCKFILCLPRRFAILAGLLALAAGGCYAEYPEKIEALIQSFDVCETKSKEDKACIKPLKISLTLVNLAIDGVSVGSCILFKDVSLVSTQSYYHIILGRLSAKRMSHLFGTKFFLSLR